MSNKDISDLIATLCDLDPPTATDTMGTWLGRAVEQELITSKQRFDINWVYASTEKAVSAVEQARRLA